MAIAYSQQISAVGAFGTQTVPMTFGSNVASGSAIWVVVVSQLGSASQLPTDSQGNTYTYIGTCTLGAGNNTLYHYWTQTTSAGSLTVTGRGGSSSDTIAAYAMEVTGAYVLAGSNALASNPGTTDPNGTVTGTANITQPLPAIIVGFEFNAEGGAASSAGTSPIAFTGLSSFWSGYLGASGTTAVAEYAALSSSPSTVQATFSSIAFNHQLAAMAVFSGAPPPTITAQPTTQTVNSGSTATLSITATVATGPIAYQWQQNTGSGFSNISGATSSSYTTGTLSYANNGVTYQCIVTDTGSGTTVTSNVVGIVVAYKVTGTGYELVPGMGPTGAGPVGFTVTQQQVTARGVVKYWDGSAWISGKPVKYWNGSSWISGKPVKYWNSATSSWVTCT